MQALKEWREKRPKLFKKKVCNLTGLDFFSSAPQQAQLTGLLMRGGGFGVLGNIVVGILGTVVGGFLFGLLGISTGGGLVGSLITAVAGATALLLDRPA